MTPPPSHILLESMHRPAYPQFHYPALPPNDHRDPLLYHQSRPDYPDMFRQSSHPPLIQRCICRLTLAGFSSFSSGHLKDTGYISIQSKIYTQTITHFVDG